MGARSQMGWVSPDGLVASACSCGSQTRAPGGGRDAGAIPQSRDGAIKGPCGRASGDIEDEDEDEHEED